MKMVKSLILGSAAGLIAMSGAQAADLPVKAKAVEYVRICSLYGAGFYYIPGTDTCIKLGGYLRVDTTFNGGVYGQPFYSGDPGQGNRYLPGRRIPADNNPRDTRLPKLDRCGDGVVLLYDGLFMNQGAVDPFRVNGRHLRKSLDPWITNLLFIGAGMILMRRLEQR